MGCSHGTSQVTPVAQSIPPESPYCTQNVSFGDPVTVTGKALFNIRQSSAQGLGAEILGPHNGAIRYVEVQILDSAGNIINCGETDANGNFSLTAPRNSSLVVNVNSRSFNSHAKVSVLDAPSSNVPYSLKQSFSTNTALNLITLPTMTASAKTDILGGAFNILFNILRANESLRYLLCGKTSVDNGCAAFTVAPKVSAYWQKGVNPYSYFGRSDALSFYSMGTDQLFILGGSNSDTDNSDTDHFDDAVISHEYGHFIEDHFGHSDSPGGGHDGDSILDARLMWSEGWADFFSSVVRGSNVYRDTYGNIDGAKGTSSTGCLFNYDIEKNYDTGVGALDLPNEPWSSSATVPGLGNFREFTITRALWDIVDPFNINPGGATVGSNGGFADDNSQDNTTSPFTTIWTTFTGAFHSPTNHFRNIGLFFVNDADPNLTTNPQLLNLQGIAATTKDYGDGLIVNGADCPITITGNDDPAGYNNIGAPSLNCKQGSLNVFCSNQFSSNDFFDVNQDGTISSITMQKLSGPAELDIYLYRENYTFGNAADIFAQGPIGLTPLSKSINLSGLPQGHYLFNINVYTGNGNPTSASTYQLFVNGVKACPK